MKHLILASFIILATIPARALIIEDAANGPFRSVAKTTGTLPAKGAPFAMPDTGIQAVRISDIGDLFALPDHGGINPAWPYAGQPGRGLTNGYSTYSCANITDEYVIAFGVQPWIAALYRTNGQFVKMLKHVMPAPDGRSIGIGETWAVRWDLSGRPGTANTIYYQQSLTIWSQDVVTGAQKLIFTMPATGTDYARNMDHSDQSRDAKYRGWWTSGGKAGVVDLSTGALVTAGLPYVGEPDLSPSGRWVLSGFSFYRIADLLAGKVQEAARVPTAEYGHCGWATDAAGNECFIFQDNKTDWFSAFCPDNGQRTDIFNMGKWGWTLNQHMSRSPIPGWFLMSTYGWDGSWYSDQLMMVEIKPAASHPRLLRLGGGLNKYAFAAGDKTDLYFAEGFASLAPTGRAVYVGANWAGSSNLELYRLALPDGWAGQMPTPGPTPTPKPVPTATPKPTATPTLTPTPKPRVWKVNLTVTGTIGE